MGITFRILGAPSRDNALFVQVDSGQAVERLLFDCGDGCLSELSFGEIQGIDRLFFSHLHMDHVGGFDTFFRCNYGRDAKPNWICGPPRTATILQNRFQGFLWNLHEEMAASWDVADVDADEVRTTRFELAEAFALAHDEGRQPRQQVLCEGVGYTVEAFTMEHRTPTLAYLVREKPRRNIDMTRLAALGLRPGPWLKQLKEATSDADTLLIAGVTHTVADLRQALLVETPGDAIAYLTDFLLDDSAIDRLAAVLRGCRTVVCEAQYRHADLQLARRNYHMTTVLTATLAQRAGVEALVLFHLSDRYQPSDWLDMLHEAQLVFPNTSFSGHWRLPPSS